MDLILKILLCAIIKLQLFNYILCYCTRDRHLFDHGSVVIDNGDTIHVHVNEVNPKLYSMYLQREKRTVDQFGKFNRALSSATFSCVENDDSFSCINNNDKSSVFIDKCSNVTSENRQNVAHIVAIIYRKNEDLHKNDKLSFYLTAPPSFMTDTPSTNDPCHQCGKSTCEPTSSTVIIQCGNRATEPPRYTMKPIAPVVTCVPLEYNENNAEYMCTSPSFKEPLRIASPMIENSHYSGKFSSYKFSDTDHSRSIKRRRKVRHLKSVKTKHKMKKKSSYVETYHNTDNLLTPP